MPTSLHKLGTAPSVDAVNVWLLELGWSRSVVGTSVQGRELVVYEWGETAGQSVASNVSVLVLSLTHGNEPMGLLSLLSAAEQLSNHERSLSSSSLRSQQRQSPLPPRVLVFPIVNIDAYTLNLQHGKGCRRTNLSELNCTIDGLPVATVNDCPIIVQAGVDLNRNFPSPYSSQSAPCQHSYGGKHPFSEPESTAIQTTIQTYNVTHAMSFHSMANSDRPRLLIHPFTSQRPLDQMSQTRLAQYRAWSRALNADDWYDETGTARETIGYSAAGSSIDYMDECCGILAFVVEAVPPCHDRWCDNRKQVMREARRNGQTAMQFVELAVTGRVVNQDAWSPVRMLCLVVLVVLVMVARKNNNRWYYYALPFCLKKLGGKEKQVAETELKSLTTDNG